jgi:hypothetical protein
MKIGDLIAFNFSKLKDKWPDIDSGSHVALVTEKLPSGGIMVRWLDCDAEEFVSKGNLDDRWWEVISESR